MSTLVPRRSLLYMPGSNARALEKAAGLPADGLIFDLEDAVSPDQKQAARELVAKSLSSYSYGRRELLVRVNGADTEWAEADIECIAPLPIDGMVIPKVENPQELNQTIALIQSFRSTPLPIWVMTETARGVLHADSIFGCNGSIRGVILGTSDLAKELRIPHTAVREGFQHLLSHCVIAARAHGLDIIDGVHLNFGDLEEFQRHCVQGRNLGFDGKSLIHPKQIEICNQAFTPDADSVKNAQEIVAAWTEAQAQGQGVCVVRGRLIENLHVEEAQRTMALVEAIEHKES